MVKYFVHNGLQFQTISVPRDMFEEYSADSSPIDAVTLESVAIALGTDIVPGGNANEQLDALLAIWTQEPTDAFQALERNLVRQEAAVIRPEATDLDDSTQTGTLHQRSWQQILPDGFSNMLAVLPQNADDATIARNRLIVESLEVNHTEIQKHSKLESEPDDEAAIARAWGAWISYEIANVANQERERARVGYQDVRR